MRWGLVPSWWKKKAKEAPATFNARAESVAEKPMFRDAFKRSRCLIPASGCSSEAGQLPALVSPSPARFSFSCTKVIKHEYSNYGRQVDCLTALFQPFHQRRYRHFFVGGDFEQPIPKFILQRDAGLPSTDHNRTLDDGRFHAPRPCAVRNRLSRSGVLFVQIGQRAKQMLVSLCWPLQSFCASRHLFIILSDSEH
jgi:hypothetical protein